MSKPFVFLLLNATPKAVVPNIENNVIIVLNTIAVVAIISAIVYGTLKFVRDAKNAKARERETYQKSFEKLVSQLTSRNRSAQLSAAILL